MPPLFPLSVPSPASPPPAFMQLFPSSSTGVSRYPWNSCFAFNTRVSSSFFQHLFSYVLTYMRKSPFFFSPVFMEFFRICSAEPKPGEISSLALAIWSAVCTAMIQKSILVWGGELQERCTASACQDGTPLASPASKKGVGEGVNPSRRTAEGVVGR